MAKIQDYAVIGDTRSVAVVSIDGSLDWLSWPRVDSPSIFGAILDEAKGGRWRIAPATPYRATRRYLPDTNVLETTFETASGTLVLTDLFQIASAQDKRRLLLPDSEIVRGVTATRGEVDLEVTFDPRPCYGAAQARIRNLGRLGWRILTPRGELVLMSELPLVPAEHGLRGHLRLRGGEELLFSLSHDDEAPAVLPPLGDFTRAAIGRAQRWWRAWAARCRYSGPYREAVVRSALALKLLAYAPSGAVIAAATASLPEKIGGDYNWDYRFCWLRDASFTVRAFHALGYEDEADAFVTWLLHSTRLTRPELRVLYDVHGETPRRERRLDHLSGYRGSRPVRVGNDAARQFQLDVYGEVVDAAYQLLRDRGRLDHETGRLLRDVGEYVCRAWRRPDAGIWEVREGLYPHTHSRLLAWTALDRLIALAVSGRLRHAPTGRFREEREAIRRDIETHGWNERLGAYTGTLDGEDADCALLLLPWYGFCSPASPRARSTLAFLQRTLGAGGPLLYRTGWGKTLGEGAFLPCSFWAAELAALGATSIGDATDLVEELLGYANDVGLYAEEIDPATGDALGNFPQAYSHVGLINAVLTLERRGAHRDARPLAARGENHHPGLEAR